LRFAAGCFLGAEAVLDGSLFCVVLVIVVSPLRNVTAMGSFV
jgi:hypothetical protein